MSPVTDSYGSEHSYTTSLYSSGLLEAFPEGALEVLFVGGLMGHALGPKAISGPSKFSPARLSVSASRSTSTAISIFAAVNATLLKASPERGGPPCLIPGGRSRPERHHTRQKRDLDRGWRDRIWEAEPLSDSALLLSTIGLSISMPTSLSSPSSLRTHRIYMRTGDGLA